jgi:NADPH2:quinone reductase
VFDNVGPAVFEDSLKCTAYNGRYLPMGFASDKTKADEPYYVPRRVIATNIKLCGVLLAYADPAVATMVKQAMGFNFLARELGERITQEIVELVRGGRVRPVIGSVVDFEQLPAAIDAMGRRQTSGRTIVTV